MRISRFSKFNEGKKNKFPNIKKVELDDFTIIIGKDAKSNDHLTFNMAKDDDIWLHVKGVPGSHVAIICNNSSLPTLSTIKVAAEFAKENSKANGISNTKVVYCKRKFVTKKSGLNDGQVLVDYNNSDYITL